jgi:hypothetical protein
MDLSNLKATQEAQKLELLHPANGSVLELDGKAFTIDLLSSDTNNYKSEFNKLMKAAREQKGEQTARDAEEKACDMLAKITTGCYLVMDGKPLKFSTAAMKDLYFNPEYTWIREQVEAFIRDRGNFIKS